jgi:hypothetical protein
MRGGRAAAEEVAAGIKEKAADQRDHQQDSSQQSQCRIDVSNLADTTTLADPTVVDDLVKNARG